MFNFFSWIAGLFTKAPKVTPEVQPLIAEGEVVVADLVKLVSDLKANNFVAVAFDSNQVLVDVKVFVDHINKVVAQLQLKQKI